MLVTAARALGEMSAQRASAAPNHVADRTDVTRQHCSPESLQVRFTVPTEDVGKGEHDGT
jgi:hypothetical protein